MKTTLNILAVAALGFLAESFLPWWSIAVVAFGVGALTGSTGVRGWLEGFGGVALLWLVVAGWIHFASGGILTDRVTAMLHMPFDLMLMLLTALVVGVVGGFAFLGGAGLREVALAGRKGQRA